MTEEERSAQGRDKEPESDDPMELIMHCVEGSDPVAMAICIIEEYALMGLEERFWTSFVNRYIKLMRYTGRTESSGYAR
ncbi:MAG: hypothetical protein U0V70_06960 [Terriglobia bacterium]